MRCVVMMNKLFIIPTQANFSIKGKLISRAKNGISCSWFTKNLLSYFKWFHGDFMFLWRQEFSHMTRGRTESVQRSCPKLIGIEIYDFSMLFTTFISVFYHLQRKIKTKIGTMYGERYCCAIWTIIESARRRKV